MRFKGLDLNLLYALNVLLEEKSVSKSAERLHLSQPAVSSALKRLRDYFNDPLLEQYGKKMIATPHAHLIQSELKAVLANVDTLISKTSIFEPETATRKFTITSSDYLAQVIFVPLLKYLRTAAPKIQIELIPPGDTTHEFLAQGSIDIAILPEQMLTNEFPAEFLFSDRFVIVGCKKNPIFDAGISESEFYASRQVVVKLGSRRPVSISDQQLENHRELRDVDILVSSFLLAPEMVVDTDRLTVMHARLAEIFAQRIPVATAPLPFDLPVIKEYAQYHSTRSNDLGVQWLLHAIKTQCIRKID